MKDIIKMITLALNVALVLVSAIFAIGYTLDPALIESVETHIYITGTISVLWLISLLVMSLYNDVRSEMSNKLGTECINCDDNWTKCDCDE